ncbi:MAG: hypothetical protein FJ293_00345 [Planctomycetes bacterium]|nr:hypothetical protein [Planctomycetota bacterium]
MTVLGRLRSFAYSHRRVLAAAYLLLTLITGGGLWAYVAWVPDDVDLGLTIAARAWFHERTFAEPDAARAEAAAGDHATARDRLERFLADHPRIQPAQRWTHAVSRAGVQLAEAWVALGRPNRGAEALVPLLERLPTDYQLWWAQGRAFDADGDFKAAARSLRRAFELTLTHPGVLDDYLAALGELNAYAEVAAAADEWDRAQVRGAPRGLIKAGIPRRPLERDVLGAVGVPVEHARFFRHQELWALPRGEDVRIEFPAAMFEPWPWREELVVQLRIENLWDGFAVTGCEVARRDGSRETRLPEVALLHRAGSGVGAYAELFTGIPGNQVASVALRCRIPQASLSTHSQRVIRKARENLAPALAEGG